MSTETFKCCRCKEFLPRDAYGGITKRSDYCKTCHREYGRAYREANKDRLNETNRACAARRYKTNRANLVEYLSTHPCVDCGISDPLVLEFDHRDRSIKRRQVGDVLGSWNWNTIMVEIEKCDVRCANCHRRKTHLELGWYTKEAG